MFPFEYVMTQSFTWSKVYLHANNHPKQYTSVYRLCKSHVYKVCICFCKMYICKISKPSIIWRTSRALWPSDNIQQHSTWSTLAQAMVCCPTAPSHYLNQCCLLISAILRHSPKINFAASVRATILYNAFENHTFKSATTSPKSQWFKVPLRGEWPIWYHEFLRHP